MDLLTRRRAMMAQRKQEESVYFFNDAVRYQLFTDTNNTNGFAPQGGCVVGSKWFALLMTQDETEQYMYCYDMMAKTWSLLNTYTTLGHANSLTYNPNANVFYVGTGYADLGLAVIDGESFEHVRTFTLHRLDGTTYAPWQVAYDRKRNLIYSLANRTMMVNAVSGAAIAERSFSGWIERTTAQGIETDGQYFYMVWSSPSNVIDVYKLSGEYVKTVNINPPSSGYFEIEEIGYDWDGRFYVQVFGGTYSKFQIHSIIFRTFGGWANMAHIPFSFGAKRETNATVTVTGINSVQIASKGTKSYNMYFIGTGYPFGYSFLQGKTCRVSYDLTRVAGTTGSFSSNIFTANAQSISTLGARLFQKSQSKTLVSGTEHVEYEFVMGEGNYVPASGKEGTYVGYAVFIYADSGNTYLAENYKFEVKLA